jgi:pilus assembly protein CpaF
MISRETAVWERRGQAIPSETQIVEPGETPNDPFLDLKYKIHQRLIEELDLQKLDTRDTSNARSSVEEAAGLMLVREGVPLARQERARLVVEIADEVLALGPLESLIRDTSVTEILVNRPNQIYIERDGILYLSNKVFRDEAHILRIIDKIIAPLGRHVDELSPMVDGRLPDGSRVNVIIPPLALDSPTISIRKFRKDVLNTDDLIGFQTFTAQVAELLRACVEGKVNMVVSGGTGTGKTTLLNVLSSYIPPNERVVTIEDPAELQLQQSHVVRLETRPSNIEGKGQVVQRDLVRNALRMRPDRIIVGEVRSGEAFDMLQAMNTGHEGSLTTVHANSPRDSLARIENMVLMANLDLPVRAVREQISSAINMIIHLNRLTDGSRRVTQISEIAGTEGDIITMQDIFRFHYQRVDRENNKVIGDLRATGLRPKIVDKLERLAIPIPPGLFSPAEGY